MDNTSSIEVDDEDQNKESINDNIDSGSHTADGIINESENDQLNDVVQMGPGIQMKKIGINKNAFVDLYEVGKKLMRDKNMVENRTTGKIVEEDETTYYQKLYEFVQKNKRTTEHEKPSLQMTSEHMDLTHNWRENIAYVQHKCHNL